jgi:hypothetical protein
MIAPLLIELVPRTSWNSNLRSILSVSKWDEIRRAAYVKAQYRCEICNGVGSKHPVECHEIWQYDDDKHIQKLIGVQALCPLCHQAKHIGFAEVQGRLKQTSEHIMKVNQWSKSQFKEHHREASKVWHKRSQHSWVVDISWIK